MNNKTIEETVLQLSHNLTRIEQKLDMLIMKSFNPNDSTLRRTFDFTENITISL